MFEILKETFLAVKTGSEYSYQRARVFKIFILQK